MRIAILGSVSTRIPPLGQGAIERLAYEQALGLAKRGHEVLLFALVGSYVPHTNVHVIEVGESESGSGEELKIVQLAQVVRKLINYRDQYEVILNNLAGVAVFLPIAQQLKKPLYHVLHGSIFPQLAQLFKDYQTRLIASSNLQQKSFSELRYVGTVYNGVNTDEFTFSEKARNYVLYLGTISKNRNPHEAILAAKEAKVKIIIGGKIKDPEYFEKEIKPQLNGKMVEWVGEKGTREIVKLYQGAKAFLFPTLHQEPFGLVLIEAMSCGTPVICYPNGAIPEIVVDGKVGFLVNNYKEMAQKMSEVGIIDRHACRKHVEDHFSIEKMIDGYEDVLTQR